MEYWLFGLQSRESQCPSKVVEFGLFFGRSRSHRLVLNKGAKRNITEPCAVIHSIGKFALRKPLVPHKFALTLDWIVLINSIYDRTVLFCPSFRPAHNFSTHPVCFENTREDSASSTDGIFNFDVVPPTDRIRPDTYVERFRCYIILRFCSQADSGRKAGAHYIARLVRTDGIDHLP